MRGLAFIRVCGRDATYGKDGGNFDIGIQPSYDISLLSADCRSGYVTVPL